MRKPRLLRGSGGDLKFNVYVNAKFDNADINKNVDMEGGALGVAHWGAQDGGEAGRAVDALGPQLARPQFAMHVGRAVGAPGLQLARHVGRAMGCPEPKGAGRARTAERGRSRLQVAGRRLQVAGRRLQEAAASQAAGVW